MEVTCLKLEELHVGDLVVYAGKTLKILCLAVSLDERSFSFYPWNTSKRIKVLQLAITWARKNSRYRNIHSFSNAVGKIEYVPVDSLRRLKDKEKFDDF